jgi:hypothetical protein
LPGRNDPAKSRVIFQRVLEAATRAALQRTEGKFGSQGFSQSIVKIFHVRFI